MMSVPTPESAPASATIDRLTKEQASKIVELNATTAVVKHLNILSFFLYVGAYGWFVISSLILGFLIADTVGILIVCFIHVGILCLMARGIALHGKGLIEAAIKEMHKAMP
jgi:type IV secretory pathway VirB6-like protein